jgi:CRISPR-associated endonuclease/helicase Cas3
MTPLLAKSRPPKPLVEHTADVLDAVALLFGGGPAPSRLGRAWHRFFKLGDCRTFYACTLAAAALHDAGKANQGFQDAVRDRGEQQVRHEHLSSLFLDLDAVRAWLATAPDMDQDIVLAAVLSHHLKVTHENLLGQLSGAAHVRVLSDHEDFRRLLGEVGARLGLAAARPPEVPALWSFQERKGFLPLLPARQKLQDRLYRLDRSLAADESRRRLLWAVRAGLIAADAVGSAQPRLGQTLAEWLRAAFPEDGLCTGPDIRAKVIAPRVDELRAKGRWDEARGVHGWSRFQEDCATLPARALLLAPCGSGKTLAAWRWVEARLTERPAARVLFLYPTRATATEGFRDYVSWAPEAEAALAHGTAGYDLEGMFENPPDGPPGDPRAGKSFDLEQRLFALGLWQRRIFAATVDQFLAFLQYGYGPVCGLPLLADSVVVVDEVHSFDRAMFSALKQFLIAFDVPVLCMTATLPAPRVSQLEGECGLRVYNERPDDLKAVADYPRYRVQSATAEAVPEIVHAALAGGLRVLWVVNQVKRAQRWARLFRGRLPSGASPSCYHSRFKLADRRARHREVLVAFQGKRGPALALTTQVCEMSLDLDADLLVTEQAPVTALIQRMGRCNRQARPTAGRTGRVVIYPPEDLCPYGPEHFEGVADFVKDLSGCPHVSQTVLEEALEKYGPRQPEADRACRFLESGPYAMTGQDTFRDVEEFTTPAVLARDVGTFLRLRQNRQATDGLIVPVPRKLGRQRDPRLPPYLAVAADDHYDPAIGFGDEPIT